MTQVISKIQYKKVHPPMLDGWVWHATYKGVFMELGQGEKDQSEGKPWVSIYLMESKNPGKGECQEMIELIKKDFPNRKLCASIPMNPVAEHIFKKHKVDFDKGEPFK